MKLQLGIFFQYASKIVCYCITGSGIAQSIGEKSGDTNIKGIDTTVPSYSSGILHQVSYIENQN